MKKNRQTNIRIGGIVQWRLKLFRSLQVRKSVTALFFVKNRTDIQLQVHTLDSYMVDNLEHKASEKRCMYKIK